MKEKIAANIVTYNRKDLLIRCLKRLMEQSYPLDAIYIIDNMSTDGTAECLKENGYLDIVPDIVGQSIVQVNNNISINMQDGTTRTLSLNYIYLSQNTGSSGGQYIGLKTINDAGYDWVWTMDDDGMPEYNCLEHLMQYKEQADFIAPLVVDIDDSAKLSFGLRINGRHVVDKSAVVENTYSGVANPFNGILLSKHVFDAIGYPKRDMFIWGDEREYLYRAVAEGLRVMTVTSAIHFHPRDRVVMNKIMNGRVLLVCQNDNKRNYIYYRNFAHILMKYKKRNVIPYFILYCYFMIFRKKSFMSLINFIRGYYDGVRNDFRRTDFSIFKEIA